MREAEENIKFKMEIDVLVPIPRTVTRDFTSLKPLRQWQKRNDIDGSLYCFAHREYLLNEKGEWELEGHRPYPVAQGKAVMQHLAHDAELGKARLVLIHGRILLGRIQASSPKISSTMFF